ncbi:helix-turn-helix domain-containing protein [Anaerotruncus colihominis]
MSLSFFSDRCRYLDCQPGDIMEYTPEDEPQPGCSPLDML